MVDWKFMHHVLTKSGLQAGQSRFCPCFLKFPWQPFGDLNWYAVYSNFVIHVILKIVFTLSSAYLVTKSFDFIKGKFRSTIGRCCIQIMSFFLSIWLPIRVLWPHLLFLSANLSRYVENLAKHIPKEYRCRFRIKPCTDLAVAILYWLDTSLAAFGIFLILVAFLISKILNRFRGERDPSLANQPPLFGSDDDTSSFAIGASEIPPPRRRIPENRTLGFASRRTNTPGNRVPGVGEPGGRGISDRARACWNWLKDIFRKPPGTSDRSNSPWNANNESLPHASSQTPREANEKPASVWSWRGIPWWPFRGSTAPLTPRESNENPASVWNWRGIPRRPFRGSTARQTPPESNENTANIRRDPSPQRPSGRHASPTGRESNENPENVHRDPSPRMTSGRRASQTGRESDENLANVRRRGRPTGRRASPTVKSNENPANVRGRASPWSPAGRRPSPTGRESSAIPASVSKFRTRTSSHPNLTAAIPRSNQRTRMPTDGSTPLMIKKNEDVVILRRSSRIRNSLSVGPPDRRYTLHNRNGALLRTPSHTRGGVIYEPKTKFGEFGI